MSENASRLLPEGGRRSAQRHGLVLNVSNARRPALRRFTAALASA